MSNFLVDDEGGLVTIYNAEDCPVESMPPTVSCGEVEAAGTCFCNPGTPDCSTLDDDCNVGVCNEGTVRCEPVPTNEGGPCDDGNSCTTTEVSIDGLCVGSGCTNQSACSVADDV